MIPRIIHQIYMQGWEAIPAPLQANIAALRGRNPDWEYRFYDETSGRRFIADRLPEYLAAYDRIDPAYLAARSDFLRYCVCYVNGGFYLDLKSVAQRPLDEVLHPDDELVLSQWTSLQGQPSPHPELRHIAGSEYVNFFIACSRENPLLRSVLEQVTRNISRYRLWNGVGLEGVLRLTGPIPFSLAIEAGRARHPHRIAHMENDLHLEYSLYGDYFSHRTRVGSHYSEFTRPVVRLGPVAAASAFLFFGLVAPRLKRLRRKISSLSAKG